MVEIEYSPIKKIVIHEAIKYNLDEFISLKVQPVPPDFPAMPLRWIDGIVFEFGPTPLTPELVNDQAKNGIVHWGIVEWSEMPGFQNNLVNTATGITRRVIDGSSNTAVVDVIRWLKNQPQWKSPAVS